MVVLQVLRSLISQGERQGEVAGGPQMARGCNVLRWDRTRRGRDGRLQHAFETAELAPSPSAALRHRLRRAVAQELGLGEPERKWSWWERPFAFAFAGAAVALVMFTVSVIGTGPGSMPHGLRDRPAEIEAMPSPAP